MKIRFSGFRKFIPSHSKAIKVTGVTLIAILAMSGPAYGMAAVLIPYLTIIQQVISQQLTKTISDGFNKTSQNLINTQVQQYTKELTSRMMPGAFCEADVAKAVVDAELSRSTGYDQAKVLFPITGADTLITANKSGQVIKPPTVVISQHNREVRNYIKRTSAKDNNCSPLQATPVAGAKNAAGDKIVCSQQERDVAAAVLVGASPPAELPDAATAGALGETYEAARTTSITRKQLAALALMDAGSEQKENAIESYRGLLGKVTVDSLTELTGSGGVQRDAATLQRLTAHLMLEQWVENLETKRLLATLVAQQSETDDRDVLAPMRRRK